MMELLSIGNSFSVDAQHYLHQMAKSAGFQLDVFNLYIGGCSLSTHHRNLLADTKSYILYMNGQSTGFYVSIREALLNRDWDVVTVQQVSSESPDYDSYQPYLSTLADFVKSCVPKAKLAFHQTWAYEAGSTRLTEELGYKTPEEMFLNIQSASEQATKAIHADFILPCGQVFHQLAGSDVGRLHRDTFHASYGLGRYALGLTWYAVLSGNSAQNVTFADLDEPVSEAELSICKECVDDVVFQKGR